MRRRQWLLYGIAGGLIGGAISAAAVLAIAITVFHVDELLEHVIGNR